MKRAYLFIFGIFILIPSMAQDVSLDKKLGAENALMVEQEMGIYQHDSLYRLVNEVGKKLVSRLKINSNLNSFSLIHRSLMPSHFLADIFM
jgi:hypothetical protein